MAKSDSDVLQGKWRGHEAKGDTEGSCYLTVTGKDFEFRGADTNEWYKGTFSLREDTNPRQFVAVIADCADRDYVGKTSYAIYRLEGATLTMAAHEPGNPDVPPGFDGSDVRRIDFTK